MAKFDIAGAAIVICLLIKWIMIKLGSLIKQERDARERNRGCFRRESIATFQKAREMNELRKRRFNMYR